MIEYDNGHVTMAVFEPGDTVTTTDRHARGQRGTVVETMYGLGTVSYRVRFPGGEERIVGPGYVRADDYCDFFPETY